MKLRVLLLCCGFLFLSCEDEDKIEAEYNRRNRFGISVVSVIVMVELMRRRYVAVKNT